MYIPLYIPKSVVYAFLFVAVAAFGWILHGSMDQATQAAHARGDAPSVVELGNAPRPRTRAPLHAREIRAVLTHGSAEPGTTTVIRDGADNGLYGQATTVNSTAWLARPPTGALIGGTAPTPATGMPMAPQQPRGPESPAAHPPATGYPVSTAPPAAFPPAPPGSVVVHQPTGGGV